MRIKLMYSEKEFDVISNAATQKNFSDTGKFISYQLIKVSSCISVCGCPPPGKHKQRIEVRIQNEEAIKKLSHYAQSHNISVAILAKRLVTDPILLQALLEAEPEC